MEPQFKEQKIARERVIERSGKPIKEWESMLPGMKHVWFMEYPFIIIGIETDGYTHS
jgi:hypothetical protein